MSISIHGTNGITFNDGSVLNTASQAARAWVNFQGTGVVTIRKAINVTSVLDNGTGDYTVNFGVNMPDVTYVTLLSAGHAGQAPRGNLSAVNPTPTVSAQRLDFRDGSGALFDPTYCFAAFFI